MGHGDCASLCVARLEPQKQLAAPKKPAVQRVVLRLPHRKFNYCGAFKTPPLCYAHQCKIKILTSQINNLDTVHRSFFVCLFVRLFDLGFTVPLKLRSSQQFCGCHTGNSIIAVRSKRHHYVMHTSVKSKLKRQQEGIFSYSELAIGNFLIFCNW